MPVPKRPTTRALRAVSIVHGDLTELLLSAAARPGEALVPLGGQVATALRARPDTVVLRETVFGRFRVPAFGRGRAGWPVTRLAFGDPPRSDPDALVVQAIRGAPVRRLRLGSRIVGSVYEDAFARYAWLGGILPDDLGASRPAQVRRVFERLEEVLQQADMTFGHVVRTWLYLDRILDWYDPFNRARDGFFRERRVADGVVPASTGIGGRNAAGAAVVAEALAIAPKDPAVKVAAVASPRQCAAMRYGSSFSRAVEVRFPRQQRLYVSGTASIGPGGETQHVGDVVAQVALTRLVVEELLQSRGLDWADVTRAVGYCVDEAAAVAAADAFRPRPGRPAIPLVLARMELCRTDLLFEIELDAVRAR